jgi:hypothetical protein
MRAHSSMVASLLTTALVGCHPTPPTAAPRVEAPVARDVAPAPDAAVDAAPPPAPDVASPFFAGESPLSPGCFAWSTTLASAACVIESPTDDLPHLRAVLRFTSDGPGAVTALVDAAAFEAERAMRPSAEGLAAARARLAREGYAPIEALRQTLPANVAVAWAPGATARWQRRTTARGGPNQAPRYTDRVTLRWDATSAPVVLTTLEERPVEDPRVAVYPVEGGRYLVVDYVGRFADEGEYGTHARAWRCDREAHACTAQ